MKILFVAGNFDMEGGRPSGLASKMASYMEDIDFYNGGYYNDLSNILKSVLNYDVVFWFANVPNDLPKVRHVKEINPKAMFISSKRNDDNKYTFKEVVYRAVKSKSNLLFEFSKKDNIFNIRILDPLGCVWYDGTDIESAIKAALKRIEILIKIRREASERIENLDLIRDGEEPDNYVECIFEAAKVTAKYSDVFNSILKDKETPHMQPRYRCVKGMPSFKNGNSIYVSAREIAGDYVGVNEFIEVLENGNKICYSGSRKTSVDTPIHIKLYKALPNINFILHSHCYIKGAPFTTKAYPCGALQEAEEILDVIGKDTDKDFYVINELGHGSIVMAKDIKYYDIEYYERPLPEQIKI